MFQAIKNLFTKAVELTSSFFQQSEIIFEKQSKSSDGFEPSQIEIKEKEPKIKQLKYRKQSKYR